MLNIFEKIIIIKKISIYFYELKTIMQYCQTAINSSKRKKKKKQL